MKIEFTKNGIKYKVINSDIQIKTNLKIDTTEFKKEYIKTLRKIEKIKKILEEQ